MACGYDNQVASPNCQGIVGVLDYNPSVSLSLLLRRYLYSHETNSSVAQHTLQVLGVSPTIRPNDLYLTEALHRRIHAQKNCKKNATPSRGFQ